MMYYQWKKIDVQKIIFKTKFIIVCHLNLIAWVAKFLKKYILPVYFYWKTQMYYLELGSEKKLVG